MQPVSSIATLGELSTQAPAAAGVSLPPRAARSPDSDDHGRASLGLHLQSPLRHHRRTPSAHREVKETLDARSEYTNSGDYGSQHHINQYIIKEEIGRGSFGAVHLAVDQYGNEYAVKEFSKSRLRKRAKSHILRRPHPVRRADPDAPPEPFSRTVSDLTKDREKSNPLYLIQEEIAIMKKLNHPNLVSLIEVLDDPDEDSLYMVLEICKKGVSMKVGLDETTKPYDTETCRCLFRDLILVHAQGIVHRDIKPDNLLITEDDVLKVVDFGVSEMFAKDTEMWTAKSAGSPAFLPPELCIAKHGDISGRAADIWSMGVSLYCFRFGQLPFEKTSVMALYESIKNDPLSLKDNTDPNFADLMGKILEKDPSQRIKMAELRNHPWVTNNGSDLLLSAEENTANPIEPPTKLEINHAITKNIKNLLIVVSAVKKFKKLLLRRHPELVEKILGHDSYFVESPTCSTPTEGGSLSRPPDTPVVAVSDAVLREEPSPAVDLESLKLSIRSVLKDSDAGVATQVHHDPYTVESPTALEHAPHAQHDVDRTNSGLITDEEMPFLGIGAGGSDTDADPSFVAESPTAVEFNVYDRAYEEEVSRIRSTQGRGATIYLTRRVEGGHDGASAPLESAISRWRAVFHSAPRASQSD